MTLQERSRETHPLTPSEERMLADLTWAATAPEVLRHPGKFVVIHDRKVLAVGTNRQALVEEAAGRAGCPWWELAVAVVPGEDLLDVAG
jgi:hypothetical protein